MKLEFSKKIYNKGYGFPFVVVKRVLLLGLIGVFAIVVTGLFKIEYNVSFLPKNIITVIGLYISISFFGYPAAALIGMGYRRFMEWSKLEIIGGRIHYTRITESEWTDFGHVDKKIIYNVKSVERTEKKRRNLVIYGDIEKVNIFQGKIDSEKEVKSFKIPAAYEHMELLEKI